MKKLTIIALMLTCISAYSQPRINAKKNPKFFNEGITLLDSGEIAKDYAPCKLIEVRKSMRGYTHTFVSDTSGIIIRHYNVPLVTDLCYKVQIK